MSLIDMIDMISIFFVYQNKIFTRFLFTIMSSTQGKKNNLKKLPPDII